MAKPERSISLARSSGCHQLFLGIRIISVGARETGQGKVILVLDTSDEDERALFGSVEDLGQVDSSLWAMSYEQRNHIYLCRDLKISVSELWPRIKKWL